MKGCHLVNSDIPTHFKNQGKNLIPGWQLCCSCYETAKQTDDDKSTDDLKSNCGDEITDLQGELTKSVENEQLDQSLSSLSSQKK